MNREDWLEFVSVGNRVWHRVPLAPETSSEWFDRLHVWSVDTVGHAFEILERVPTGGRWPELAAIIQTCRDVERGEASRSSAAAAVQATTPGIRLTDWLDAGAPDYPDGEEKARRIWAAVMRWQEPVRSDDVVELHLAAAELEPGDVAIAP